MKAVAQKYEHICLESADRWELFDTVAGRVAYTAFKAEEPAYLDALIEKWGFEGADFEVGGYGDLIPDWEALGYPSGESMLEDRAERNRRAVLAELATARTALGAALDRK